MKTNYKKEIYSTYYRSPPAEHNVWSDTHMYKLSYKLAVIQ